MRLTSRGLMAVLVVGATLTTARAQNPPAGAFDVTGHWAQAKGTSPDFDVTGPNVSIYEIRNTPRGIQFIVSGGQAVEYVRSATDPNLYNHARAGEIVIKFSDSDHGRIDATNDSMRKLQGNVRLTVTNRREFAVLVNRLDTNQPVAFPPIGQTPAGFLFPNQSRTATLPRGIRIEATDLMNFRRYLEWQPVVRDNEQVNINGFSLGFTNETNTDLAVYDLDLQESGGPNSGLLVDLPRGKFVKLSARPGQRIAVIDFATGQRYFEKAIQSDMDQTLQAVSPNVIPILGTYERNPVENDWHTGRITAGPNNTLKWTNKAGASWTLTPDLNNGRLQTGSDNPYQKENVRDFHLEMAGGRVNGFRFNNEFYRRVGN